MKQLIILFSCLHFTTWGQDYFSTLTQKEEPASQVQNFKLGTDYYSLGYQSDSTLTYSHLVISQIADNGLVNEVARLGRLSVGRRTLVTSDSTTVILATRDSTIVLLELDRNFNEIRKKEWPYPNSINFIVPTKLLIRDDYLYASGWSTFTSPDTTLIQDAEEGWLMKINRADFELEKMVVEPNTGYLQQKHYDMEFHTDSTLMVAAIDNPVFGLFNLRLDIYDLEMNKISSIATEITSTRRMHFEILENKIIVHNLGRINGDLAYAGLWAFSMTGEKIWELDVEDQFTEPVLAIQGQILDMRVVDGNQLLLCGELFSPTEFTTGNLDGFIMKIDSDGEVIWKRRYREGIWDPNGMNGMNGELTAALTSFVEHEDGYLFSGYSTVAYIGDAANFLWTLKTNREGCVDEICEEYGLLELEELDESNKQVRISPNPSNGTIHIDYEGGLINRVNILNELGQTITSISNVNKQSLTMDLNGRASGLYYVRIWDADRNTFATKRFILIGG